MLCIATHVDRSLDCNDQKIKHAVSPTKAGGGPRGSIRREINWPLLLTEREKKKMFSVDPIIRKSKNVFSVGASEIYFRYENRKEERM